MKPDPQSQTATAALPVIGPIPVEVLATGADWPADAGRTAEPLASIWLAQDCPICPILRPSRAHILRDLYLLGTADPVTPPGGGDAVPLRFPYLVFPPDDQPIELAPPPDERDPDLPTFQLVDPENLGLDRDDPTRVADPSATFLAPVSTLPTRMGPAVARTVSLPGAGAPEAPVVSPRDLTAVADLLVDAPNLQGGTIRESFRWYRLNDPKVPEPERHLLLQRTRCPVCPRMQGDPKAAQP